MSRFSKIFAAFAVVAAAASCGRTARIDAVVTDAPSSDIIVKQLNVNTFETLDTVALDAAGKFSYKVEIQEGQIEFVYLYKGSKRIASLLLEEGDKSIQEVAACVGYDDAYHFSKLYKKHFGISPSQTRKNQNGF